MLSVLFIFIMTGCVSLRSAAQGLPHKDSEYKIEEVKTPLGLTNSFWVNISFEGENYLREKEKKSAEAELRRPDYSDIPAAGILTIQINAVSYRLARPENCAYIIRTEKGEELARRSGNAELTVLAAISDTERWFTYDTIVFDAPIDFPLQIRIVNRELPAEYWEYQIKRRADDQESADQEKS